MKLLRWLLVGMLASAAQAQAPQPLVITAHNVTAETVSVRGRDVVARPGDVIRYALVFTNVISAHMLSLPKTSSRTDRTKWTFSSPI